MFNKIRFLYFDYNLLIFIKIKLIDRIKYNLKIKNGKNQ